MNSPGVLFIEEIHRYILLSEKYSILSMQDFVLA